MIDPFSLHGLTTARDGERLRVSRNDQTIAVTIAELTPWVSHHLAWGIRRAMDRWISEYDVTTERQQTEKARNVYEITSPYGTRLPKLASDFGLHVFETLTNESLVTEMFVDGYAFVFREDDRRGVHLLTESDLERMPFEKNNIVECAKYALFNSGMKARSEGHGSAFESTDGRACGVVSLFPDFVYDLANAGATAFVESENRVLVVPRDSGFSEPELNWLESPISVTLDGVSMERPRAERPMVTLEVV